jgi:hypothetical protein
VVLAVLLGLTVMQAKLAAERAVAAQERAALAELKVQRAMGAELEKARRESEKARVVKIISRSLILDVRGTCDWNSACSSAG